MFVSRCLGDDLHYSHCGIRFICICPTFVQTSILDPACLSPDDDRFAPFLESSVHNARDHDLIQTPEVVASNLVSLAAAISGLEKLAAGASILCSLFTL